MGGAARRLKRNFSHLVIVFADTISFLNRVTVYTN